MMLVRFLFVCALLGGPAAADPLATQALNSFRSEQGRGALGYDPMLEAAAAAHAQDMAEEGFFDHQGSDGSTVAVRVSRQGYGWCTVAENIAKGYRSLDEVMEAWATSPGHRRNMLSPEVSGFGLVEGPDRIWVMVLAAPGC